MSIPDVQPRDWRTVVEWQMAATALIIYDHALTFSDEIRCIWNRKFSVVTVVYLLARYLSLLDRVVRLLQWVLVVKSSIETAGRVCDTLMQLDSALSTILYIVLAAFSALRVYAIWGGNRVLATIVLCLALGAPTATAYYSTMLTTTSASPPFSGCIRHFSSGNRPIEHTFSVIESFFAVITEVTVVGLTWVKTASIRRISLQRDVRTPLVTLLQRDGSLYLVAIAIPVIISVLNKDLSNMSALTAPFAAICYCRFMLNLSHVYLSHDDSACTTEPLDTAADLTTGLSTHVGFSERVVTDFGASLHVDSADEN